MNSMSETEFVASGEFDLWLGSILEALSEGAFSPFRGAGPTTRQEIEAGFEEEVAEILAAHLDDYKEDPDAYLKRYGSSPEARHPWGDEVVARCRLFIKTATPHSVWEFYETVRRKAVSALEESLVEMAFLDDESPRVARAAARAREEALRSLIEDLDKMGSH